VEDDNPAPPDRRRLWVAVAATMVALPLLLLDNLTADADDDREGTTSVTKRAIATVVVPLDRPETGPPKGISVVTSSTTSSTVPITVATTTTQPTTTTSTNAS
jgi:hypothetical protein